MNFSGLTRKHWLAIGASLVALLLISKNSLIHSGSQALEISIENAGSHRVFAYIDDSGRHVGNPPVESLLTTDNARTPIGLLLRPAQTRTFGTVDVGNLSTVYILPVDENVRADTTRSYYCPIDTEPPRNTERLPRIIKIKWTGRICEVSS